MKPVEVVAGVTIAVLVAIVVFYSVNMLGRDDDHAAACNREAASLRRAYERFRDANGTAARPSIEDLRAGGFLIDPPAFHTLTYSGTPPVATLDPVAGGNCAVVRLASGS
jgi:hypothetical protein